MSQVVLISGVGELTNSIYTVEPLNNGHVGTDHFVHYREVVLFGGKNVMPLHRLAHRKVSFIQRCPLFRVSFIRGSTVLGKAKGVPLSRYMCIYIYPECTRTPSGPKKVSYLETYKHYIWDGKRCSLYKGVLIFRVSCLRGSIVSSDLVSSVHE